MVWNLCAVQGHKSSNCPNKDKCRRCGQTGHFAQQCTNAWGTNSNAENEQSAEASSRPAGRQSNVDADLASAVSDAAASGQSNVVRASAGNSDTVGDHNGQIVNDQNSNVQIVNDQNQCVVVSDHDSVGVVECVPVVQSSGEASSPVEVHSEPLVGEEEDVFQDASDEAEVDVEIGEFSSPSPSPSALIDSFSESQSILANVAVVNNEAASSPSQVGLASEKKSDDVNDDACYNGDDESSMALDVASWKRKNVSSAPDLDAPRASRSQTRRKKLGVHSNLPAVVSDRPCRS